MVWEEITNNIETLKGLLNQLRDSGIALAQSEQVYRKAKAKKELELKNSGMSITLIPDLTKGDNEVSTLAFQRDCQEVIYKHSQEAINVYKKELDVLKMYFDKEYSNDNE